MGQYSFRMAQNGPEYNVAVKERQQARGHDVMHVQKERKITAGWNQFSIDQFVHCCD